MGWCRSPRRVDWIIIMSMTCFVYSFGMLLYGVGACPIFQGIFGILTSMEGYYGAMYSQRSRIRYFIWGLAMNVVWAVSLGIVTYTVSVNRKCVQVVTDSVVDQSKSLADCRNTYILYSWVQFGFAAYSMLVIAFTNLALGNFEKLEDFLGIHAD